MPKTITIAYWGTGLGIFFLIVFNLSLILIDVFNPTWIEKPSLLTIGIWNLIGTALATGFFSLRIFAKK